MMPDQNKQPEPKEELNFAQDKRPIVHFAQIVAALHCLIKDIDSGNDYKRSLINAKVAFRDATGTWA